MDITERTEQDLREMRHGAGAVLRALEYIKIAPGNLQVMIDQTREEIREIDGERLRRTVLSFRVPSVDNGNVDARDGLDRCACGSKYWAHDCCIDCGTHVSKVSSE